LGDFQKTYIYISGSPNAEAGLRHEAQCLADNLCEFEFLILLIVWYDLLFQINVASKAMQGAKESLWT